MKNSNSSSGVGVSFWRSIFGPFSGPFGDPFSVPLGTHFRVHLGTHLGTEKDHFVQVVNYQHSVGDSSLKYRFGASRGPQPNLPHTPSLILRMASQQLQLDEPSDRASVILPRRRGRPQVGGGGFRPRGLWQLESQFLRLKIRLMQ